MLASGLKFEKIICYAQIDFRITDYQLLCVMIDKTPWCCSMIRVAITRVPGISELSKSMRSCVKSFMSALSYLIKQGKVSIDVERMIEASQVIDRESATEVDKIGEPLY